MTILEKNLSEIKKIDSAWYEKILDFQGGSEDTVEVVPARNNSPVIKLVREGKDYYFGSTYNPERECDKFVAQYEQVIDYSVMIFLGFGNGEIASRLVSRLGGHVRFVFYEPSADVFYRVIENWDITALLQNPRVMILVKDMNDDKYSSRIGSLITPENYRIAIFDALPVYRNLFPEDFKTQSTNYRYFVETVMSNLGVNERFGKQTVQNEIYNLRYLAHCNSEEDFEGVFPEDAPAIVVAAGPSLEKNVDLLQEAKGKALIVAVDTIFKYLMDRGIRPDVVVTADPHKGVHLFNFPGASTVPVAFDSPVNYRILDIMKDGKPIFISSECPYYNKLYETIGRQMYTLTAGGSVATLAFALVVAWGFRRIVLVGQDLALSPDKVHAGNVGTDRGRLQGELIPVEGYYGDTVYTSPDYYRYLEWYNIVVANNLDIEVINATEGGARIQGAVNMSLREVIDTYCNQSFDFEKTILEFPVNFDEKAFASIRKEWIQSIENLTQLGFKLVKGIGLVKTEITKIRKGKYSQKEVATVQKQINQILEECDSYSEIYFVDFLVSQKESDLLGDIYFEEKDSADECCRILDKLRHYMEMLENAIDEVKAHFTYILEQTQEEVR